jgi:hypothetical protein
MGKSERDENILQDPFYLTVDQYGRLWLHTKLEGQEMAIDLAEKNRAFQIMAATLAEHQFKYEPGEPEHDGHADNDDDLGRN